jgi:hypothetical protein
MHGETVRPTAFLVLFATLLVMQMALLGLGFGILISSLTTKYRDLNLLVYFRRSAVDVCDAGGLSALAGARKVPLSVPPKPDG